jgi:arylsulfatase
VLPLDARSIGRALGRPRLTASRGKRFIYYPNGAPIEAAAAVNTKNRSHTITAEVEIPEGGAEGVLIADGGRFGGYSLYVKDRQLCYSYNLLGKAVFTFTSDIDVPAGKGTLGFGFEKTGPQPFGPGGIARLYINGTQCGEGQIPRTVPFLFALGTGLQIGCDAGNPVTDDYASPFRFTGTLRRVIVDLSGAEPPRDLEQEARIEMARQ